MKRSKVLLAANILATAYGFYLLYTFGTALIQAGGAEYLAALKEYFELFFEVFGMHSPALSVLYTIVVLLGIHIFLFLLGTLIGWIAFARKKSGGAKCSATFYLIATLCFPIFIFFTLPITIIGYIGGSKQKKLNNRTE